MPHQQPRTHLALLGLLLLLLTLALGAWLLQTPPQVRGKSAALPLSGEQTPQQELAQDLALSDPRVQAHTVGRRSEVFGVRRVSAGQTTAASRACATADCRQVEIYLFDENTTITAIVNIETETVLDVLRQPGVQAGINKRLADRALEIALASPDVIQALGFRPLRADIAPVPGDLIGSSCDGDHLCAAPNFQLGDRILWAVVDLTEERLAGTFWTSMEPDPPGNATPSVAEGCPAPGNVSRNGWKLKYETTGSDGLHVYDVTYQGDQVLTSVKHLEWHADYGNGGYRDSTGCGDGGGGFSIQPYGQTQILPLYDEQGEEVGFELVQDFRMTNWGYYCNYRYEPHLQFFKGGSFRVASAIYGRGCSPDVIYRVPVRIDVAVNGDSGDYLSYWDGWQWVTADRELYRVPYVQAGAGPTQHTAEGYAWRVSDEGGGGYYVVADRGQFPHSRGDNPFVYFTQHHEAEGDTDMGVIGPCCFDDQRQGPDQYVNDEPIAGTNVVLWYVPQMQTDASTTNPYCWTFKGEPEPDTHPCIVGPLFVPSDPNEPTVAAFDARTAAFVNQPVAFKNASSGLPPLSYSWDFGDGSPTDATRNPVHAYAAPGVYTVKLTASNAWDTDSATLEVHVETAPTTLQLPLIVNNPDG